MGPEAWRRKIGEEAFDALFTAARDAEANGEGPDWVVATVLSRATELGFTAPKVSPAAVNRAGTTVLWPDGVTTITAAGIKRHWESRGHGFLLLRAGVLMDAVSGPLAIRLQEILAAYEEECRGQRVTPLPKWADWQVFVGGEGHPVNIHASGLTSGLVRESPMADDLSKATVAGPEQP